MLRILSALCMNSLKVTNIVKLAAILFMLIRQSNIKTQLVNRASRFEPALFTCMLKRMSALFIA